MMKTIFKLVFTASFFSAFVPAAYAETGKVQLAPVNPAFLEYLQKLEAVKAHKVPGVTQLPGAPSGRALGRVPSPRLPVIMPAPAYKPESAGVTYPSAYDLRDHNKLTPVKDQGNCGSCWTYGAFGSMESYLKPLETWDFSESDLNINSGFDAGPCNGGNDDMSAAYLTRWNGPLTETSSEVVKHAQNIIYLTPRASATDNDRIKNSVQTYGGLTVTFYYDDNCYKESTHSFYCSTGPDSNHEVTLVGWDDNYPKTNFASAPAGNGAFICKNSWGTGWGDDGYFYVSYYDATFGTQYYVSAFTAEPANNYNRVYSYDKFGWVKKLGYGTTTGWYSNIFTAVANEGISAAGFYADDSSVNYTVYLYTGVTAGQPRSGSLAYTGSGTFSSPGYYTVPLGYHLVPAGQRFSVVVKATNAGSLFPIPVESKLTGYSSGAAASGQSYASADGTTWDTLASLGATNASLKAYAISRPPEAIITLTDSLLRPVRNPAVKCKINVTTFAGGNVSIKAYTLGGAFVRTIFDGPVGTGSIAPVPAWDGRNEDGALVASGLYLVHVKGPGTSKTVKVVVIK